MISNGLPLTKLHHAAFDAHLIGIDPDYQIHVSDGLLESHDGPFLELGLKGIAGTSIDLLRSGGHTSLRFPAECPSGDSGGQMLRPSRPRGRPVRFAILPLRDRDGRPDRPLGGPRSGVAQW